jgi:hypothetical protein
VKPIVLFFLTEYAKGWSKISAAIFELCGRIVGHLATVIIIVLAVVLTDECGYLLWCDAVAVVCVLFVQVVGCAIGSIGYVVFVLPLFQGVADLCGQPFRLSCAQSNPTSPQQTHTPPPSLQSRQLKTPAPF